VVKYIKLCISDVGEVPGELVQAGERLASMSRPRSASSPAANSRESSTAGSVGLCDDGSRARVGRVINCESAVKTRRSQWLHAERARGMQT